MDYPPRVYDLSLHTVGLIVGFLLLAIHFIALVRPEQTKGWLLNCHGPDLSESVSSLWIHSGRSG